MNNHSPLGDSWRQLITSFLTKLHTRAHLKPTSTDENLPENDVSSKVFSLEMYPHSTFSSPERSRYVALRHCDVFWNISGTFWGCGTVTAQRCRKVTAIVRHSATALVCRNVTALVHRSATLQCFLERLRNFLGLWNCHSPAMSQYYSCSTSQCYIGES